jgi:hypothetical protein
VLGRLVLPLIRPSAPFSPARGEKGAVIIGASCPALGASTKAKAPRKGIVVDGRAEPGHDAGCNAPPGFAAYGSRLPPFRESLPRLRVRWTQSRRRRSPPALSRPL